MTRLLPAPIFKQHLLAKVYSGDKTQTRRICKPQPIFLTGSGRRIYDDADFKKAWADSPGELQGTGYVDAPYGAPGDFWHLREGLHSLNGCITYKLDNDMPVEWIDRNDGPFCANINWRWKRQSLPSMHMPRDCARRFARVTNVRVERVQDISTGDCWAEGIPSSIDVDPRHEFAELWDSINAERGHSWESNPFVWVYEWELVERDAIPAEAWVK